MDNKEFSLDILIERLKSSEYTNDLIYTLSKGIENDGKLPTHKASHVIYLLEKIIYVSDANPNVSKVTSNNLLTAKEDENDINENENESNETDNDGCDCHGMNWRVRLRGCNSSKCEYRRDYNERLGKEEKTSNLT